MTVENIFMIYLHERMLQTSAGIEPATFWSSVGRRSNWATKAGNISKERGDWQWHAMKSFLWSSSLFR